MASKEYWAELHRKAKESKKLIAEEKKLAARRKRLVAKRDKLIAKSKKAKTDLARQKLILKAIEVQDSIIGGF